MSLHLDLDSRIALLMVAAYSSSSVQFSFFEFFNLDFFIDF